MPPSATLTDVLLLARQLSAVEKAQLIAQIAPDANAANPATEAPRSRRTLRGLLRGCNISAEDIDAARLETWRDFPRGDI